ncbi:dimethyl sulfoxide reductase anchor subunit family protein [Aquibaculum arenosum]|uniref:Dimethyl sulfoxide reductase anchor subunit n=1 Tax=Aquibaculum arenosum TaxID=3032591 RepID=A0ABT5YL08_9PROT|nr:DmsC/YnfH family molybdoenzyme membrane anchor subunit [Fodinicurvata sp. CAU 1616]MDF2095614.1 dimethyl sulfoxide reductase anchor subunit [Fodinicurvata sp. CAU 1616]
MHPAYSVILFTSLSGAGYGLLGLLGLTAGTTTSLPGPGTLIAAFLLAFLLITGGLLASTFHLGHPERAWRALSQWRSSWLSREGVLALATYPPALIFAWLAITDHDGGLLRVLGLVTAFLCAITVVATAMIYASLATIRQWHQPLVVPVYLAFALASGATLLLGFAVLGGQMQPGHLILAGGTLVLALLLKTLYWRAIDQEPLDLDMGKATGLGHLGRVRQWEGAHTAENFVQQEMGYRIGRRHAGKLRRLITFGLALALLCVLLTAVLPGSLGAFGVLLALAFTLAATLVERWLFFAEAQHVVTLYYGAERA